MFPGGGMTISCMPRICKGSCSLGEELHDFFMDLIVVDAIEDGAVVVELTMEVRHDLGVHEREHGLCDQGGAVHHEYTLGGEATDANEITEARAEG